MFFVECVDFGQDGVIFGDHVRTLEFGGSEFKGGSKYLLIIVRKT